MKKDFVYTQNTNPHVLRGRELIKKYPQLRSLMGNHSPTSIYLILLVVFQLGLGYLLKDSPFWAVIFFSYTIGAIVSHALFALIHEATHNLIFKKTFFNNLMGLLANIGQGFPSYFGFKTFHMIHHSNLNEYDYDADLAAHWEAKLVKNKTWRKIFWYLNFLIIESIRPERLKNGKVFNLWTLFNIVLVIFTDILIYKFLGPNAFWFVILSSFFGVGLHPVGGRWIQEHYTFKKGQETYSYYGPGNIVSFNVGYHNEHHDIMTIPWVHLPKLKEMAPEYYNHLYSHQSWTKVLWTFLFNQNFDLYSRIVRNKGSKLQPTM